MGLERALQTGLLRLRPQCTQLPEAMRLGSDTSSRESGNAGVSSPLLGRLYANPSSNLVSDYLSVAGFRRAVTEQRNIPAFGFEREFFDRCANTRIPFQSGSEPNSIFIDDLGAISIDTQLERITKNGRTGNVEPTVAAHSANSNIIAHRVPFTG
jgi:hypothetical protein